MNFFVPCGSQAAEYAIENGISGMTMTQADPEGGDSQDGLMIGYESLNELMREFGRCAVRYAPTSIPGLCYVYTRETRGQETPFVSEIPNEVERTVLQNVSQSDRESYFQRRDAVLQDRYAEAMEEEDIPNNWDTDVQIAALSDDTLQKYDIDPPPVRLGEWELRVNPRTYLRRIRSRFDNAILRFADETPTPVNQYDPFTIHIWSSPVNEQLESTPEYIFDTKVTKDSRPFVSEGNGYIIRDNGYDVAELFLDDDGHPTDLYIHHDCRSRNASNERHIFSHVLDRARDFLEQSPEDRIHELRLSNDPEYRMEMVLGEFADRIVEVQTQQKQELEQERRSLTQAARETEKTLRNILRNIRDVERQLQGFDGVEEEARQTALEEFERILNMPKVVDVAVVDRGDTPNLRVETKELLVEDPRTSTMHVVGRMRFFLPLTESGSSNLYFENLDRTVLSRPAPHVFRGGNPCQGNMGEMLPELFVHAEYAAITSIVIQYLESVNVNDSYGRDVDQWPEATDEQIERFRAL
jgi:hypothetical protein